MASDPDSRIQARIHTVADREAGQRIDNFLVRVLKGVPRSRIYRALRSGEVRVGGGRVRASYKLQSGDPVRIPPIRQGTPREKPSIPKRVRDSIEVLYGDEWLMVVNKPAGLAVHGGTGMDYGLIEALRDVPEAPGFLELVHRLDRETSGCLLLARSRKVLKDLHHQLGQQRDMEKTYYALVQGQWQVSGHQIDLPLRQQRGEDGKKRMIGDASGSPAFTRVSSEHVFNETTLLRIELLTGRMHQARVHCATSGHPIAGDWLYGNSDFNRFMKSCGLDRMFLHAGKLGFTHPMSGERIKVTAPMPTKLNEILGTLEPE